MSSKLLFVHLFHIIFVGALFLYVGIERTNIPKILFPLLLLLGIMVIMLHAYKLYNNIINKTYTTDWVHYIHILLVGPLLMIIGYNGISTSRRYFELLIMAGMASIGYHGYYVIKNAL
jgi:hypothetical protein